MSRQDRIGHLQRMLEHNQLLAARKKASETEFDRACRAFFDYARRADTEAAMRAKGLK